VTRSLAALTLVAALAATGCTHALHQATVSGFEPPEPLAPGTTATRVSAEAEQFVVLSIASGTDFVEEAREKLLAACPDGQLVGVLARHSTDHGPLSYTNRLRLEGTCLRR